MYTMARVGKVLGPSYSCMRSNAQVGSLPSGCSKYQEGAPVKTPTSTICLAAVAAEGCWLAASTFLPPGASLSPASQGVSVVAAHAGAQCCCKTMLPNPVHSICKQLLFQLKVSRNGFAPYVHVAVSHRDFTRILQSLKALMVSNDNL